MDKMLIRMEHDCLIHLICQGARAIITIIQNLLLTGYVSLLTKKIQQKIVSLAINLIEAFSLLGFIIIQWSVTGRR